MSEADFELQRLPPPEEKTELARLGIEIREQPISGAATGELPTIIIATLAGVAGGLLGEIGKDIWGLLKSYFLKRYRQLEGDRQRRAPHGGRFLVKRIYVVSRICGVPVVYYFTPTQGNINLDVNKELLLLVEQDIAMLAKGGELTIPEFLGVDLNHLGDGPYLKGFKTLPNILHEILSADDHKLKAYTHAIVAMSFEQMSQPDAAIRHYRITCDALPDDAKLRVNLGAVFARKGDLDSALREYRRALSIDGDTGSFHYNLACFYAYHGHSEAAAAELRVAIEAGFHELELLLNDPDFAPVRDCPEVVEVISAWKGKLNHANIVQTADIGEAADYNCSVTEHVEGKTVADDLMGGVPFGEKDAIEIIIQVAHALAHAHAHGFVHRDVKPKNIVINEQGVPKLVNSATPDIEAALSKAGETHAPPYYTAPEQIRCKTDIDGRTDIYSLGATFYHMATGRVPFAGDDPSEIMRKHLRERLIPPDHINTSLSAGTSRVIEIMMAKRREYRYNNVEELLLDLEALRSGQLPLRVRKRLDIQ